MIHSQVYTIFTSLMPSYAENAIMWFPNGKNSIRVRMITGQDFIFTYHKKDDWCFETVNSFIKKLRGGK